MDLNHQNTANICLFVLRDLIYKVEHELESDGNPYQLLWSDLQLPAYNLRSFLDATPETIIVEDKQAQAPTPETAAARSEVKRAIGEKFNSALANTITILERLDAVHGVTDQLGNLLVQLKDLMERLEKLEKMIQDGGPCNNQQASLNTRAPLEVIDENKIDLSIGNRPTDCHFSLIELNRSNIKREFQVYDTENDENKLFKKVKVRCVGLSKRRK